MGVCEVCKKSPGTEEVKLLEKTHLNYMENYICKINGDSLGTGFFCKIEFNNKKIPVLMTCYHIISDDFVKNNKYIEIYIKDYSHIININKDSKIYSSKKEEYDIMIIKINEDNNKINNYLEIDSNIFKKDSFLTYQNEPIYILHYPNIEIGRPCISYGNGIEKINEYNIKHKCYISYGSSGGPILSSLTNKVIGIHKGYINKEYNIGIFLSFLKSSLDGIIENNFIIAEIYIKDGDINKDIRIINSFEEYKKTRTFIELKEEYMNEKEINKCQIEINDESIPFNYYHKFNIKGNYKIKYSFMNYLTKTNHMFTECSSLINIDLSNFNTQNVTDMDSMFSGCSSLTNINLSNFNTQNVTDMDSMFSGCSSLTNINLYNFNTQNVRKMSFMFCNCSSLINIDLSNFNTQNVTDMSSMFWGCSSLVNLDLSNFNTQNVTDMRLMFYKCSSLKNINLSNFNTQNVIEMRGMFAGCESLINIDLSNFNTQNVNNMTYMFSYCSSLQNINLSNFNTQNVEMMMEMFSYCSSLKYLDLSNFNTQNILSMANMFVGCESLKKENVIAYDNKIFEKLSRKNYFF